MSLLFSTVTVTPKQGAAVTILESGHPDEYDLRELLRCDTRYAPVRKAEYHGATVQVRSLSGAWTGWRSGTALL